MKQNKILALVLVFLCVMAVSACTRSNAMTGGSSWPGMTAEDGIVYTANGTFVEAIQDGKKLWSYPAEANNRLSFFAAPAVDESHVYAGSYDNQLFILNKADAIEVPDLNKSAMSREESVAEAEQLSRIAIGSLAAGKQLCFYPSGHVKTIDKEIIGNRRMAYEVCRELPAGVRVILCRMRGLEGSYWSKLKPKKWKLRRTVTMHFEDHTDELREWAQTMDRRTFNQQLENWYNDNSGN